MSTARPITRAKSAATSRALKQGERLGSVVAGKLADLVILDADPTADIRKVIRVIRDGIDCDPQKVLESVPRK
jgi:imidazolonepropionase-like amidohydrolase